MFNEVRGIIGSFTGSVNPELSVTVKNGAKQGALLGGGGGGTISLIGLLTSGVFVMKLGHGLSGQGSQVLQLKTLILRSIAWTWHFKYVIPIAVITCGLSGAVMGARLNFHRWTEKKIGITS